MAFTSFGGDQGAPQGVPVQQEFQGPPIDRGGSGEEEKQGLLGRIFSNPFVQGMGLAASFGANPLAGLLVAPQIIKHGRELAKVGNEERRFQLQQRQRAEIARDRLPGLLQDPRQGQLAQSLLDIGNPQLTSGLLSSRTNTTTQKIEALQAEARRRGLNPEETNAFIDANLGGGNNPLEAILAELTRQKREQDIQEGIAEQEDRAAAKLTRQGLAGQAVTNLIEIGDINSELEGLGTGGFEAAFIQPGGVIPESLQRVGTGIAAEAFGSETADRARTLQDRFDQIAPELAFDRIAGGLDANSQAEFRQLSSTKPSREAVGPANDAAILKNLRALLLSPDLTPADRRAARDAIKKIEKRQRDRADRQPTPEEAAAELRSRREE